MKRLVLLGAILAAAFAAACGGGGTVVQLPPPPVPGGFSNASFNGQYAFSMSGRELCVGVGSFFARAGSITADGAGHITGGVEDVNTCTGVLKLQFTGGTYSVQPDGRGILSLTNNSGTTNYSISLSSNAQGFIVQTDAASTASGSLQKQDPTAFSVTRLAGPYVFDVNGITGTLDPESIVGRFFADGVSGLQNVAYDSNIAGAPSGQQFLATGGFYSLDANASQTGRGTINIAGTNYALYIVDATRFKLIGTGFPEAFLGEAFAQVPGAAFTNASLSGPYSFLIGGSSTMGPISTAGRFAADGVGNITGVFLDENNNGGLTLLPKGTVTGTYTVDANGLGGGTITWNDSTVGAFSFIFYLASPTQAVFQETDNQITSDGTLLGQTNSPITAATLAGKYVYSWSGVSNDEEDFVGQLSVSNATPGAISGTMDFNEFGPGKQFFNFPIAGTLTLGSNPANNNTFQVQTTPNPPTTFNFTAYVVNTNTFLLVGVDGNRVIVGTAARQP
jgi:hypothetical protein